MADIRGRSRVVDEPKLPVRVGASIIDRIIIQGTGRAIHGAGNSRIRPSRLVRKSIETRRTDFINAISFIHI